MSCHIFPSIFALLSFPGNSDYKSCIKSHNYKFASMVKHQPFRFCTTKNEAVFLLKLIWTYLHIRLPERFGICLLDVPLGILPLSYQQFTTLYGHQVVINTNRYKFIQSIMQFIIDQLCLLLDLGMFILPLNGKVNQYRNESLYGIIQPITVFIFCQSLLWMSLIHAPSIIANMSQSHICCILVNETPGIP